MNSLPRPRRGLAARILATLVVVPMLFAACSGGGLTGGGDNPANVVKDALAKIAAKDIDGLGKLACAGQEDKIRQELGMSNDLGAALPGVDTKAITDSVNIDTSKVTLGEAVVTGDSATVPVTGTMSVTFDKEKLKPIIKQVMEAQGGGATMTDEQLDAFLTQMGAGGQDVPLNESITLKKENGAWKLCEPAS